MRGDHRLKAWLVLLLILLPWLAPGVAPAAPSAVPPPRAGAAGAAFTAEEVARSREYATGRYVLFAAWWAVTLGLLGGIAATGAAPAMAARCERLAGGRRLLSVALAVAALQAAHRAVTLPLSFYGGFLREHAYGMSAHTGGSWLAERGKAFAVDLAVLVPLGVGLAWLAGRLPRAWPVVAWLCFVPILVALVMLAPVLLDPLFHEIRPLADPSLEARVRALGARAGVEVRDVRVMDASRTTTRLNAYVTGLLGTRRVALYDTLLAGVDDRQVDLVVAHELGHWKHSHVALGTLAGAAGSLAALGILGAVMRRAARRGLAPGSAAAVPLLALCLAVLNLGGMPLGNAVSRHLEAQADLESLELTRDPEGFVLAEASLARRNLSDLDPPRLLVWLLYTHPPVRERVAMAERWAAGSGTMGP